MGIYGEGLSGGIHTRNFRFFNKQNPVVCEPMCSNNPVEPSSDHRAVSIIDSCLHPSGLDFQSLDQVLALGGQRDADHGSTLS